MCINYSGSLYNSISNENIKSKVLVIFDNFVMRGNRTTKASASNFNAFKSPNYTNIGHLGLIKK
jgi:L-asparaginase